MNEDAQKIKEILDQFQGLAEGVNKSSSPFGEEVKKQKKFEVAIRTLRCHVQFEEDLAKLLNDGWRIAVATADHVLFVREVEVS